MTIFQETQSQDTSVFARFSLSAIQTVGGIWTLLRNRKSITQLGDLNDQQLEDIGITRRDLGAALDQPISSDPSRYLADLMTSQSHGR